jgi:hypothetical protein
MFDLSKFSARQIVKMAGTGAGALAASPLDLGIASLGIARRRKLPAMRSFMSFALSSVIGIGVLGLAMSPAQAVPTLLVDNGQLLGADNVNVAGNLFDVRFVEGSCNSLFSGCTSSSFPFPTHASATVAGQALLDQVFIDTGNDLFDTDPTTTLGCTTGTCTILVPGTLLPGLLSAAVAFNGNVDSLDRTGTLNTGRATNIASNGSRVFAVFTAADNVSISEPSLVALFGAGLFGVALARRWRPRI